MRGCKTYHFESPGRACQLRKPVSIAIPARAVVTGSPFSRNLGFKKELSQICCKLQFANYTANYIVFLPSDSSQNKRVFRGSRHHPLEYLQTNFQILKPRFLLLHVLQRVSMVTVPSMCPCFRVLFNRCQLQECTIVVKHGRKVTDVLLYHHRHSAKGWVPSIL